MRESQVPDVQVRITDSVEPLKLSTKSWVITNVVTASGTTRVSERLEGKEEYRLTIVNRLLRSSASTEPLLEATLPVSAVVTYLHAAPSLSDLQGMMGFMYPIRTQ